MSRKQQKQAEKMYLQYTNMWLYRILRLAYSSIVWSGIPKNVDLVYMEKCLNANGSAIIVYDSVMERAYAGQNISTGILDLDAVPINRAICFRNGMTANYTQSDSVIIFNNSMRVSDMWVFRMLAQEMADIDMAVKVNLLTQQTMPIIPAPQQQKLSIEAIFSNLENHIPYTVIDDQALSPDALRNALTFDNRKSFTSDLMISIQREKWNRILSFLGINNLNIEKRERTTVPEVNSNLDELLVMRNDRLAVRRQAADQMKEIFGWKVSVKYVGDMEGGGIYGDVYNRGAHNLPASVDEFTSRGATSGKEPDNQ